MTKRPSPIFWRASTRPWISLPQSPPTPFADADARVINIKASPRELTFPAPTYLHSFAIPNFYFHMTMAYAILRANGLEIGKGDFLGG
jgi:hypothetical protein